MSKKVDFVTFFAIRAEQLRWDIPDLHLRMADWFARTGGVSVLLVFRGGAKSTLLAIYNAWRLYLDPEARILHQSADDKTAYKTSRDTQHVLRSHPLTKGMIGDAVNVEQWWVRGSKDARNASFYGRGILSNVTSSRADECQNDDIEVPKNISSSDLRERLRYRLNEQTFILVPNGASRFIGTPHTWESIYYEKIAEGAEALVEPMFHGWRRVADATETIYECDFRPRHVFTGIGAASAMMVPEQDFQIVGKAVKFHTAPRGIVDIYGPASWESRFNLRELLKRRKQCSTLNTWDSQYMLEARPVGETRLDPALMTIYDWELETGEANGSPFLRLGDHRMVGGVARWDCALGKINTDASAFCYVLTDDSGRLYWHLAHGLTGDVDAQCQQIKRLVILHHIPHVTVETNGPGTFVPPLLRKHLVGTGCTVSEDFVTGSKNEAILDAFEPALSGKFLFCSQQVVDSPAIRQLRDFNPKIKDQPDDYIDAGARAIRQTPVRIGRVQPEAVTDAFKDWRPNTGVFDVDFVTH